MLKIASKIHNERAIFRSGITFCLRLLRPLLKQYPRNNNIHPMFNLSIHLFLFADCDCHQPTMRNVTFSPSDSVYNDTTLVTVTCDVGMRFNDSTFDQHITIKNFTCSGTELISNSIPINSFQCVGKSSVKILLNSFVIY